jgi:hypothetical protein
MGIAQWAAAMTDRRLATLRAALGFLEQHGMARAARRLPGVPGAVMVSAIYACKSTEAGHPDRRDA